MPLSEQIQSETKLLTSEHEQKKPIIAILTVDDKTENFKGNRENFKDIILEGEHLGFCVFVVTIKDLKLSQPTIKGFIYSTVLQNWISKKFPRPTVIYNRIPTRSYEEKKAVRKKINECLCHCSIQLYNPYFFNKWNLFRWLAHCPSTRLFLPQTKRMSHFTVVTHLLKTHKCVYLKPENGKEGNGIMKVSVTKNKNFPYRLQVQQEKGPAVYYTSSLDELWSKIKHHAKGNKYIVQQGMQLASFHKRPFDLRVLVQKNGIGEWSITGIGARLAGKRGITTHVPRGGTMEKPEYLLEFIFGKNRAENILDKTKKAALLLAKTIEKQCDHLLGEMSMDLGVSTEGNLCFFEANAKPMKFDEPKIRKKSILNIFKYSCYLMNKCKKIKEVN